MAHSMSAAGCCGTTAQHAFWQHAVLSEERYRDAAGNWPVNTWPHRDGSHEEAKLQAQPHLDKYYARGFPHEINNSSRGVTQCFSEDVDNSKSWQSSTRFHSLEPYRHPTPRMHGEHVSTNVNTNALKPDHPLSRPHMNSTNDQKTVPRVRRTREVPWGPPVGPPVERRAGEGKFYARSFNSTGMPLKHGRLTQSVYEAARRGELQQKSLARSRQLAQMRLQPSPRAALGRTHDGVFFNEDSEPPFF